MKVGIMTWHRGWNYGTILQSYALQAFLKKELNLTVQIIDYINQPSDNEPKNWRYFFDNPLARLKVLYTRKLNERKSRIYLQKYNNQYKIKEERVKEFCQNISYTKPVKTSKDFQEICKDFDAYICGSDQIWNPTLINKRYYLDFVPKGKRKISYAPSLGTSTVPHYMWNKYQNLLKDFYLISTREKGSADILTKILGRKVEHVLDPTFLLSSVEWSKQANESECPKEEYLLCYFLTDNPIFNQEAERLAKEKNLKIISLVVGNAAGYEIPQATINVTSGPREFIGLIKNAKIILTNSFHCTVFSIIYHKDFYTYSVKMKSKMANINFRYQDLFSLLGLNERYVGNSLYKHIDTIHPINYTIVQNKLDQYREHCIEFLRKALSL